LSHFPVHSVLVTMQNWSAESTTVMAAVIALVLTVVAVAAPAADAAPCLIVTLTGSGGGPPTFNGLAGPGTLVRYGDDSNNCNTVKM
jgi:ribonuclease Z